LSVVEAASGHGVEAGQEEWWMRRKKDQDHGLRRLDTSVKAKLTNPFRAG
jgi:hypothetical protein